MPSANDSLSMNVSGSKDGKITYLFQMYGSTALTKDADSGSLYVSFPRPIKMDRGTSISFALSTNAGGGFCILYGGYREVKGTGGI